MFTIIIALVIISILVFVHEFGHFIAARKLGVRVEEFGFGFPPRLWGWERNNTTYSINWIPLGGFVKLKGETGDYIHHHDSFAAKSVWRRFVIVVAGVLMNFLLAIVIFAGILMVGLPSATDNIPAGGHVRDEQIAVGRVLEASPASRAGLEVGDAIVSVDDQTFAQVEEVQNYIREHENALLKLNIKRGKDELITFATPTLLVETGRVGIGVGLLSVGTVSYPWYLAPIRATQLTYNFSVNILEALYRVVAGLIGNGRLSVDVSGPVGIAVLTGNAVRLGVSYLLQFVAILSINLGVINLLPIPALDGSRLIFLAIEKIRRRPLSKSVETVIHQIGFVLLLTLIVIVTFRDLTKFSGMITDGLRNMF